MTSAVAHADVQKAVGSELQLPAVVRGEILLDRLEDQARRGVGDVRIGRDAVPRDHRISAQVRIVDVESAVCEIVRVKREAQQPALAG